ncbi:MAG TPA: hypothetical protein VM510_13070 [Caulifigura sp.]|nr:hypothetical protein [Caulifigura sp.]
MNPRLLIIDRLTAAIVVAAALLVHGPLFVRSPLGPDPVMYDLQAQLVARGGVLYQDLLEPNLPGAVWVHLAVRSMTGWSPEALRAFDLAWFALAEWLAARLMTSDGRSRTLLIVLLTTAYSTVSEWCHCQRDVWMLPFVLGAVSLRIKRISPVQYAPAPSSVSQDPSPSLRPRDLAWLSPIAEGLLWGAAVWLKPHVVLPATLVILACSFRGDRPACRQWRDEALVILGGAVAGAAGVLWLVQHDAWSPLWTMLTEWNRDYVAASANRWSWGRLWSVQERLAPWSLIHLVAVPEAIAILIRRPALQRASIIAALYLGWLAQSLLLQHLFDYVHLPALVLGALVVAELVKRRPALEWTQLRFVTAAIAVLVPAIVIRGDQLTWWRQCAWGSSSPAMTSALARLPLPEWNHLAEVERFLSLQGVSDGELTAYHTHTIHLYPALKVTPSTRFAFTETHLRLFPGRAAEIAAALDRSRQRFVVSDLIEAGLDPAAALGDSDPDNWRHICSDAALTAFPFDQPVVFRSGPYLVHEVHGPVGPVETGFFPLAAKTAGL